MPIRPDLLWDGQWCTKKKSCMSLVTFRNGYGRARELRMFVSYVCCRCSANQLVDGHGRCSSLSVWAVGLRNDREWVCLRAVSVLEVVDQSLEEDRAPIECSEWGWECPEEVGAGYLKVDACSEALQCRSHQLIGHGFTLACVERLRVEQSDFGRDPFR